MFMRIVLLSLCLLACSIGRAPPEGGVDTTAETTEPRPTPKKGPYPNCEGFAEAEAARRARHEGPCPFCPCACTPERGVFCAPCVACNPPGPEP